MSKSVLDVVPWPCSLTLGDSDTLIQGLQGMLIVWHNFLHVFYAGGCLCTPSDDDRCNNIAGAIRDLRVNYLLTTPSLARTLDPAAVPDLKRIVFGGELLNRDDVARWGPNVEIRDSYGPSECTVTSAIAVYGQDFTTKVSLGRACCLNAWIASCLQPHALAPIGATGELVLESPMIGRGYLKDPDRTEASFICDPPWLLRGGSGMTVSGRKGRLYKTGDLVKYDSRGILTFMGRKDTQVKIRGQRVELEEIEVHARRSLGESFAVAVEMIEINVGASKSQVLMMFLSVKTFLPKRSRGSVITGAD